MSDREEFEKRNTVPHDATWSERKQGYYWSNYPGVAHPFNNDWEIWQEAIEFQAARATDAEPVVVLNKLGKGMYRFDNGFTLASLPNGKHELFTHPSRS